MPFISTSAPNTSDGERTQSAIPSLHSYTAHHSLWRPASGSTAMKLLRSFRRTRSFRSRRRHACLLSRGAHANWMSQVGQSVCQGGRRTPFAWQQSRRIALAERRLLFGILPRIVSLGDIFFRRLRRSMDRGWSVEQTNNSQVPDETVAVRRAHYIG